LKCIKSYPFIYWISDEFREKFGLETIDDIFDVRQGIATGNNNRFVRFWWELNASSLSNEVEDEKKWTSNFIKQIYDNINNYLISSEKNDKYYTKLNEFKNFFFEEINELTNNIVYEKKSTFINALKNGD
jgi:hypothetical protein